MDDLLSPSSGRIENYGGALPSINADGKPPESRVTSAAEVRNLVNQWINNDLQGRSPQRALVDGLVQGNPPYRSSVLRDNGRADATNVNWRTAEAYEEQATGAFYDLFSEAPTFCTIELDAAAEFEGQDPEKTVAWGNIITEEFHCLMTKDRSWDSTMQNSQRETVRFGAGPLIFCDRYDWRNRWVPFGMLVVPEDAWSDVNRWETAAIVEDLYCHELYDYIYNEKAATEQGWYVDEVKNALIYAAPEIMSANMPRTWEWVQQQLKQNSYTYSARCKVVKIAHFFAREFRLEGEEKGKITYCIIVFTPGSGDTGQNFLYKRERLYSEWQECIHPMYYSQGQGGKHYGVTGQGVKMFGAMEAENRLICNAVDKAFAPKVALKPSTASGKQKMLPQRMGDYMMLPDGYDLQQIAIHSLVEEGLRMRGEISRLVSANLSTYRQNLEAPKSGNPLTKAEVEIRAGDQARLGKTQLSRYYEQLDWLYEEKYRRACNGSLTKNDPGGAMALEFQKRCQKRGVPKEALLHYYKVKATRVVGQGSQYLRTQSLDAILSLAGALPEDGRSNLIQDTIAARAGQYAVDRYYPQAKAKTLPSDQLNNALTEVSKMKTGVQSQPTSTQNPLIFATVFIKAGTDALQGLQQSQGNMQAGAETLAFLKLLGPATAAHLARFQNDPTRAQIHKGLTEQFKELAANTDKLERALGQAMQQQQEQARQQQQKQMEAGRQALQITNGQDPELVVGLADVQRKSKIDTAKTQANLQLKAQKQAGDQALKTAKTRADIALADSRTAAELVQSNAKHRQDMRQGAAKNR